MKISECSHIRLRDGNCNGKDVQWMIKRIEDFYQIDFRTLPQWEQLVQRMQHVNTFCKQKILDSNHRKAAIINKLMIESYRLSPFTLTDNMARTAKKWQIMDTKTKMKKESMISLPESVQSSSHKRNTSDDDDDDDKTMGEERSGRPNSPNTDVIALSEPLEQKEDQVAAQTKADTFISSHLPPYISSNLHKYISLLRPSDRSLSIAKSGPKLKHIQSEKTPEEWLVLRQSTNITSEPNTITIENNCLEIQTIPFSLVNCATKISYLNVRYKGITDDTAFKHAKVIPATPVKLFPGVAVNFKFVFKLDSDQNDFTSHLYFRVGQKVYAKAPIEGFCIPVQSKSKINPSMIRVTETVNIPPMYFWRINAKSGFPSSDLTIDITSNECYDLHITKLKMNLAQESETNISIKPMSATSDTIVQREEDYDVIAQSKTLVSTSEFPEDTESVLMASLISLIIDDVIQLALDVFVFEKTYLHLEPYSKQSVKVFQTKAEHIGFHQNLYELAFTNSLTEELVFCKTIKVFGEVLPNPIQVHPSFLDMTEACILNGRCEDHFTIVNTHRALPVTIKIKLTTKMKKMIRIVPMRTHISTRSSVDIFVSLCSKDLSQSTREDYVHLTFKIIVIGDKSVYSNLPPIFYEMLVPCTSEFKKLYNNKFFNEFYEPSLAEEESEPNLPMTPMPITPSSKYFQRNKR